MGLFGRRRKADPATDDLVELAEPERADEPDEPAGSAASAEFEVDEAEPTDDDHELERPYSRVRGPFDRSEVDSSDGYLDLGSLWLPAIDGMQLRLELDDSGQAILGVNVLLDGSVAQVQAYAAPRTVGVWQEIRTEMSHGVLKDGGTVSITDGPFGKQLLAGLRTGTRIRCVGIDGPRWFLRAVCSGPAADDDAAAEALVEMIRKIVVVRGGEAMPPRELLPLRVPAVPGAQPAAADAVGGDDATDQSDEAASRYRGTDISPFARGPEITEVR